MPYNEVPNQGFPVLQLVFSIPGDYRDPPPLFGDDLGPSDVFYCLFACGLTVCPKRLFCKGQMVFQTFGGSLFGYLGVWPCCRSLVPFRGVCLWVFDSLFAYLGVLRPLESDMDRALALDQVSVVV